MKNTIIIPDKNGKEHYYDFRFNQYISSRHYYLEDVCVIDVYKFSDHNYRIKFFFYKNRQIGFIDNITSKKEALKQIEFAIEQNLYKGIR